MYKKNIVILSKNENKIIDIESILYISAFEKKVIIHMTNREEVVSCKLKDIYEKINDIRFIQCHKSYIINLMYLQTFNHLECRLQNETVIPIGRSFSKNFKDKILKNEFENIIL